jgi:hypothetical protein
MLLAAWRLWRLLSFGPLAELRTRALSRCHVITAHLGAAFPFFLCSTIQWRAVKTMAEPQGFIDAYAQARTSLAHGSL